MTFEEWCEAEGYHPSEIDRGAELWAAATASAREIEREACAKVCEELDYASDDPWDGQFTYGEGAACAAAIRQRSRS